METPTSVEVQMPLPSPPGIRLAGQRTLAVAARNSMYMLGAQVLLKVFAVLFNILVVRRLGPAHFGQYATVMAYVGLFSILTDWGLAPLTVREVAEDPNRVATLLPNVIFLRSLFSCGVLVIAPLSAYWLGREPALVTGILLASAGQLLYAFQGPLDSVLTGRERMDYAAALGMLNQCAFWILGTLALLRGMGFLGLIGATLIAVALTAIASAWLLRHRVGMPSLLWLPGQAPALLKAALPFGLTGLADVIVKRFDVVLISFVLGAAATGWYGAPYTLITMLLLLAQSLGLALFPSLVREAEGDQSVLSAVLPPSLRYLLILCLPAVVGGTLLAGQIIPLLYTSAYAPSIPVLQLLVWSLPALFLLEIVGRVAFVIHEERRAAQIDLWNAAITVVITLVLVHLWGISGAALAFVLGRTLRLLQYVRLLGLRRLFGGEIKALLRLGLATLALSLSVLLGLLLRWPLLFIIGGGALVYCVAVIQLGALTRAEWEGLRSALVRLSTLASSRVRER